MIYLLAIIRLHITQNVDISTQYVKGYYTGIPFNPTRVLAFSTNVINNALERKNIGNMSQRLSIRKSFLVVFIKVRKT